MRHAVNAIGKTAHHGEAAIGQTSRNRFGCCKPTSTGLPRADNGNRAYILRFKSAANEEQRWAIVDRAEIRRVVSVENRKHTNALGFPAPDLILNVRKASFVEGGRCGTRVEERLCRLIVSERVDTAENIQGAARRLDELGVLLPGPATTTQ